MSLLRPLLRLLALILLFAGGSVLHAGRLEGGQFTALNTFGSATSPTSVTFQNAFDNVPVVVAISDQQGGNAASIRITNVTTAGFSALIIEPDNYDGPHIAQAVQYIAVEPGRHVLPDGSIIEANRVDISNIQKGPGVAGVASWSTVNYSAPLGASVALLAQIQTANSESANPPTTPSRPHITAIVQNAGTASFQLALERSQALTGPAPVTETVGWIAMTAGGNENFPDISGNTINWASRVNASTIRGWSNGCFTTNFGLTSAAAVVVAKKTSRNNNDGGWFRYCSQSSTTIGLRVDEDTDQDGERSVAAIDAEQPSIIAFSQPFHANLRASLSVTKVSQNFVSDVDSNHFALPNASYEYLILVTNSGNAPPNMDSVEVIEQLPPGIEMFVNDVGGAFLGPVELSQGSPASGLDADIFSSLGSTADAISFSTDGTNFNYTPAPDIDGYDSAVTHFRVNPTGFLAANRGSGNPSFTLRFRARIK
ncbi:MAG: H-type lectin domain-containing protein [Sphingorhabdus sp.]